MSKRSPLFYVGDKYKLIDEIKEFFPDHIRRFVEPFVGGGSVFMNVDADEYILNDINESVISIHNMLCQNAGCRNDFLNGLYCIIDQYNLSCSLRRDNIPYELKSAFPKTYFAEFNREAFGKLRTDYNNGQERDVRILYLLLIYGFNRMIRFNGKGNFNVPVGNVDFNQNVLDALNDYFDIVGNSNIHWATQDFRTFISGLDLNNEDLVYLDPPYLITFSEYNKLWNDETEAELLHELDEFNACGIRFAISNVTHYKGRVNEAFLNWAQNYNTHPIHSNYISYHDNTIKRFNEVLVTNF